jgi:hypothetical protein
VEEVFTEMDADGSGYLDEDEVMKAVAMLGFAVDKANLVRNGQTQDRKQTQDAFHLRKNCAIGRFCPDKLRTDRRMQRTLLVGFVGLAQAVIMEEMDPDGNGEVTLDEFRGWWKINVEGGGGGGGGGSSEEVADLKSQLAEAHEKLKHAEQVKPAAVENPLDYVTSARSKLRKVSPDADPSGSGPVKIEIDTTEVAELLEIIEDESEAVDLCVFHLLLLTSPFPPPCLLPDVLLATHRLAIYI